MLLLLHGPAISASRAKLLKFRQKFESGSVLVLEKGSDPQDMMAALMTPSLLGGEQLIILENPPEDFSPDSSLITHHSSLVVWFDKELGEKSKILQFVKTNKGEVFYFPPEKELTIFPFLDLLAGRNPNAYVELNNLQKTHEKFSDNQYLITMILYQLRNLVTPNKLAPSFVKAKLEKQRKNFTTGELVNLYKFVLDSDYKIKIGLMDETQARFLMVNKFLQKS